jgi:hypothetical protein
MKLKGLVTMHWMQAQAFQRLLVAAQRFRREATIYDMTPATERAWDELGAALDALQSHPLNTEHKDA